MQGKKTYQEQLFTHFLMSERVPEHNFYRQLKSVLDLNYLYQLTKPTIVQVVKRVLIQLYFLNYVWSVIWRTL